MAMPCWAAFFTKARAYAALAAIMPRSLSRCGRPHDHAFPLVLPPVLLVTSSGVGFSATNPIVNCIPRLRPGRTIHLHSERLLHRANYFGKIHFTDRSFNPSARFCKKPRQKSRTNSGRILDHGFESLAVGSRPLQHGWARMNASNGHRHVLTATDLSALPFLQRLICGFTQGPRKRIIAGGFDV